jgi:glucosamine 6-phosphate synthetase-like amidotransferase/phosphosugar isomerase protein
MLGASDACAIVAHPKNVVYRNDGEPAHISRSDFSVTTIKNEKIDAIKWGLDWKIEDISCEEYEHFM